MDLVHSALTNAWAIFPENPMHFIFDYTYSARQFNRNELFLEHGPLPSYGPAPYEDLTESDEDGDLAPYIPRDYK